MSNTNDGGPAFPCVPPVFGDPPLPQPGHVDYGMTLRDYFAAKAMQAMVGMYSRTMRGVENAKTDADCDITTPDRDLLLDRNYQTGEYDGAAEIANDAYIIADAMIAARGGGK